MVEIFKTNVDCREKAENCLQSLKLLFPKYRINFDLDDCDHILRVEAEHIEIHKIIVSMADAGFYCELFD